LAGGLTAGLSSGVLHDISNPVVKTLGHAAVGGVAAEIQGGDFVTGALSAGLTNALAPGIDSISNSPLTRTFAAGVVAGGIAEATGGDFADAAVTGAFLRAYNHERGFFSNAISKAWDGISGAAGRAWTETKYTLGTNLTLDEQLEAWRHGTHAGVAGFSHRLSFGLSGTGGFDVNDPYFRTGQQVGGSTQLAMAASVPVAAWSMAGMPMMNVAWGPGGGLFNTHVVYGVGNTWVHATQVAGSAGLVVTAQRAASYMNYFAMRQIQLPVLYPHAVVQTGQPATNCATAAASAFVRGWGCPP
jgi:hypothetical protein